MTPPAAFDGAEFRRIAELYFTASAEKLAREALRHAATLADELARVRAELAVSNAPKNEFYWCIECGSPAEYYGVRANSPFPEWSTNHELAWHFSTKEQAELMKSSLLRSRNYGPHDLRVCDHVNILTELPLARHIKDRT